MLDTFSYLPCSKLCWHNQLVPTGGLRCLSSKLLDEVHGTSDGSKHRLPIARYCKLHNAYQLCVVMHMPSCEM